jgi:7-keto-8-aminopelargonate synthetase-like enzyme
VFVETTLLLSIVYILVDKSKDWRELDKDKLTVAEQDELVREWRDHGRAPLTPIDGDDDKDNDSRALKPNDVVVHKMQGRLMEIQIGDLKELKTVLNFANFDFLGMSSDADIDIDATQDNDNAGLTNPVKQKSRQALLKYGCGSCGPLREVVRERGGCRFMCSSKLFH